MLDPSWNFWNFVVNILRQTPLTVGDSVPHWASGGPLEEAGGGRIVQGGQDVFATEVEPIKISDKILIISVYQTDGGNYKDTQLWERQNRPRGAKMFLLNW